MFDIPSDWEWQSVATVAAKTKYACVGGPFGSKLSRRHYVEEPGVPVIRGQNVGSAEVEFKDDDFIYVSKEKAETLISNMAYPGDLVFTQRGTLGQVGRIPERANYRRYVVSQSQMKLTVDETQADAGFVYAFFRSNWALEYIARNAITTGVPHINLGILREFPVPVPPLSEQRRIASVLGALDDKIELNRKMNQTLEAMAQALFKSWFVDFDPVIDNALRAGNPIPVDLQAKATRRRAVMARDSYKIPPYANLFPDSFEDSELGSIPAGWTFIPVSDAVDEVFDGPHATPKPSESGVTFLGIKNLTGTGLDLSTIRYISEAEWPRWTKRVVPRAGDIVFCYEARLGDFAILPPGLRCCLGRRMALIRPKGDGSDRHFLFHYFIGQPFQSHLYEHTMPGSTVDRISLKNFPRYPVLRPSLNVVERFEEAVRPTWEKIHNNQGETTNLAVMRDTLLPKLISGEVRVPASAVPGVAE